MNWKPYEKVKYLPLDCNNQIWTPDIHDIKNQRVLLHPDIIEPLRIIRDGEFEYFLMIFISLLFGLIILLTFHYFQIKEMTELFKQLNCYPNQAVRWT